MTGNPSGTATATVARRGGKEAVCKAPAERTETAYEASSGWANGPKDGEPYSHPERVDVNAVSRWSESDVPYPGKGCQSA
jgi:hypothetical protein